MAPPLLTLQDIHLSFGVTALLTGAELMVAPGDRLCLVGRNGSGKSSLMKIAAGLLEADGGERFIHPGATVRYLPQEPDLNGFETVLAYVEDGLAPGDDPWRARMVLGALGMSGEENPASLSGGEARRAALARTLAPEPDILFLDEPTNHLDLPAIEWLEDELSRTRSALVLISHDRRFLESLSRATVWLDRGIARRLDKSFAHFEDWRDEVLAAEELEQHKLARQIAREEDWMRYGVTARRKRNVRRVGELKALKDRYRSHSGPQGLASLEASDAEQSGKLIVEAKNISKRYGERLVVRDFSARILRGERIGLVGPNGAGKTTLLNMLVGNLEPDTGSVRLGAGLEIAQLDQKRAQLEPRWTLAEALTGGGGDHVEINGQTRHIAAWMKDFLFRPEQARTPVHVLSGGERARVMLARALALPGNVMVLDEPTNDLDLETLDLLQDLIFDYAGTVLLVSHDRDFLDRTVNRTIAYEGDGNWQSYAGGYSDMIAQRGQGVRARSEQETPARTAATPAKAANSAASPPSSRAKLSFKDKHALETLPGEIDALTQTIARLEAELADPALFSRNPGRFQAASKELEAASQARETKEERWLELEMLREEIEAGS
ncbi:MAG: ATP-binding cassette, subfamily F, uup [Oceanicaulis sp. HLUCCA04]|nr:MAG: ATP-binding cassette, subfamily F, uup [Oceanicaulis sp. HLUCCA04]